MNVLLCLRVCTVWFCAWDSGSVVCARGCGSVEVCMIARVRAWIRATSLGDPRTADTTVSAPNTAAVHSVKLAPIVTA